MHKFGDIVNLDNMNNNIPWIIIKDKNEKGEYTVTQITTNNIISQEWNTLPEYLVSEQYVNKSILKLSPDIIELLMQEYDIE